MIETLIISTVFVLAILYLGRNTFNAFFSKSDAGCAKGCASCGAVNFDKINLEIEQKSEKL